RREKGTGHPVKISTSNWTFSRQPEFCSLGCPLLDNYNRMEEKSFLVDRTASSGNPCLCECTAFPS
ncbi:unnamed protein product, partial [Allacma fusca]